MLKHIILIGIAVCCILHGSWVFTTCIDDHCTDAVFCNPDTTKAHPTDCNRFYYCNHGAWLEQQCAPTTQFDIVGCICNYTEHVTCNWCNETATDIPISPGPCDNIPEPCVNNEKYPDRSDCQAYYECKFGDLVHSQCGYMVDKCTDAGTACAFDVYTSQCTIPDASFDCDYRCLTTVPYIPTTEALTTLGPTSLAPPTTDAWTTMEVPSTANPEAHTSSALSNLSTKYTETTPWRDFTHERNTDTTMTSQTTTRESVTSETSTAVITTTQADDNGDLAVYLVSGLSFLVLVLILIIIFISCRQCRRKPEEKVPNSDKLSVSSVDQQPPPLEKTQDTLDQSQIAPSETIRSDSDQMDHEDFYNNLAPRRPMPIGTPSNLWRTDPGLTYDTISLNSDKWLPHSISNRGYDTTRQRDNLAFIVNPAYQEFLHEDSSEYEIDDHLDMWSPGREGYVGYDVMMDTHTAYRNPVYEDIRRTSSAADQSV